MYLKLVYHDVWPPAQRHRFEEASKPMVSAAEDSGLRLVGAWVPIVGMLGRMVEVWAATDAVAMENAEKSLRSNPCWRDYQEAVDRYVGQSTTYYLRPAPISPDAAPDHEYPAHKSGIWLHAVIDLHRDAVNKFYELLEPAKALAAQKGRILEGAWHPINTQSRILTLWWFEDEMTWARSIGGLKRSHFNEVRQEIQDLSIARANLCLVSPASYSRDYVPIVSEQ